MLKKRVTYIKLGEWHGLGVNEEACHSKGQRFESRPFLLFWSSDGFHASLAGDQLAFQRRREWLKEKERPAGKSGMKTAAIGKIEMANEMKRVPT